MSTNKIICCACGDPKKIEDYYSSSSYFMRHFGKVHTCKKCIWDYVEPDLRNQYDMSKVKIALRMIDKPFIQSIWDSSVEEAETKANSWTYFKVYMKNIALPQNINLNWDDSNFNIDIDDFKDEDSTSNNNSSITFISDEEISFWGKGYTEEEYIFLENEKHKLMVSFECPDYGMEMIMKDICFINLEIDQLRQERKGNNQKTLTNLIETRSKLMNDANMKPIQSTGSESNDQITFGTLIRKWENERPVPKPLDDEMKEYIDTFMIGHLAKMQGLNNETTKKYDEALSEYTVKFEDIQKDEEYEDD